MMFTNPMNDVRITSNFGQRFIFGKYQHHQGIDLVPTKGDKRILASKDGEVILARWMDGYGNVIMIRHTHNNKTMETVYAHLEKIQVKTGCHVKQGQPIGIMGNTGNSTGPHLHFEIHEGKWMKDQPNAVDPKKYVDFKKNFENEVKFNVIVGQFTKENEHLGKSLSEELTKRGYYNYIQKL